MSGQTFGVYTIAGNTEYGLLIRVRLLYFVDIRECAGPYRPCERGVKGQRKRPKVKAVISYNQII